VRLKYSLKCSQGYSSNVSLLQYFFATCEFYWGTTTFAEAFERTGKHVCITVSASRASSGSAQRLLLNHISTPHVTLASAVVASCALPGVMKPANLQAKNSCGKIEDFEVDGVQWIDGSVQADLPFQRISTLFNVSNYVVCQTNFHVLPFLNKEHHPNSKSTYWKLFQTIEWDIRNRALKLSRLGLFPKLFGQDISKWHISLSMGAAGPDSFKLHSTSSSCVRVYAKYSSRNTMAMLLWFLDSPRCRPSD
jgi:predicted acylesterase/phospholipase RssA